MRFTIRTRLAAIVGAAVLAFIVLVVSASLIASRLERDLETIQGRYLPKMDLGPRLAIEFEGARRGFQDAVAARDLDAVTETRDRKAAMLTELAAAHDFLDPAQAAAPARAPSTTTSAPPPTSRAASSPARRENSSSAPWERCRRSKGAPSSCSRRLRPSIGVSSRRPSRRSRAHSGRCRACASC